MVENNSSVTTQYKHNPPPSDATYALHCGLFILSTQEFYFDYRWNYNHHLFIRNVCTYLPVVFLMFSFPYALLKCRPKSYPEFFQLLQNINEKSVPFGMNSILVISIFMLVCGIITKNIF